ncbi:LysM peptidoglycan-binding domain-containing protein [Hymenobacter sp. YC55]|uniref:LysM peptidoglycan-binding domain-containing protein n=1 Tax=Hymenobacter sp. YC55 TaxID=3034019 RepID=UPI0023FA499E|nr:LysM peptidoglycan-binding domain-containing protein [Hymenobacter sp. YC55]MDF7809904.1 LysM peptidoglycan-binding domain-containing protein [Hymenobacter sp. YC55]
MKTTLISAGQSLLDVCLQELGTLDALFDLADANGLSCTAVLRPGQVLQVPDSVLSRPEVVNYFAARSYRINVADAVLPAGIVVPPDEPDTMQDFLPSDFKKADFK